MYRAPGDRSLASLRKVRKAINKRLRPETGNTVLRLAEQLIQEHTFAQWFVFEVVHHHQAAMEKLNSATLKRLGQHLSGWGEVDPFACYLSGPAWRENRITDKQILQWATSSNRWWRRVALVSTVALNNRARGGSGDLDRTVLVCEQLKHDRDDMIVKALSWALRELTAHYPKELRKYLKHNSENLPARVLRELGNKLETGLKNPKKIHHGK
jgi:3-methyladenine DNA glycosylase AlkD